MFMMSDLIGRIAEPVIRKRIVSVAKTRIATAIGRCDLKLACWSMKPAGSPVTNFLNGVFMSRMSWTRSTERLSRPSVQGRTSTSQRLSFNLIGGTMNEASGRFPRRTAYRFSSDPALGGASTSTLIVESGLLAKSRERTASAL